ncbi:MAG TPA: M48 family metallopeptidase [Gemmatimonadales bacterium]|nr:M48 family metallopeptidase [Gemmatimonadales bacterium]
MTAGANLFEQQARNRRLTVAWLVLFILFFAWLGFGGDLALYLAAAARTEGQVPYRFPWIGVVVTTIAAITAWVSWRKGPQQVLWSTGARELTAPQTFEEKQLVNVVEEMAVAAGLPKPRVYVIDDQDPNAFATGRDAPTACIAVTTGLLAAVNREELQGVIAHEMGHVRNLDVRLMTLIASLVGVIVVLSNGMGRMLRGGGGLLGGRGRKASGPLALAALVVFVLWVITLILAPFISRIMAMAVSRDREYLADATGAELTRNPGALASALQKIETHEAPTTHIKEGAAHLCIADPLGRDVNLKEGRLADLLATHPPMAMRITRLKGMAFQQLKAAGQLPAT